MKHEYSIFSGVILYSRFHKTVILYKVNVLHTVCTAYQPSPL